MRGAGVGAMGLDPMPRSADGGRCGGVAGTVVGGALPTPPSGVPIGAAGGGTDGNDVGPVAGGVTCASAAVA